MRKELATMLMGEQAYTGWVFDGASPSSPRRRKPSPNLVLLNTPAACLLNNRTPWAMTPHTNSGR